MKIEALEWNFVEFIGNSVFRINHGGDGVKINSCLQTELHLPNQYLRVFTQRFFNLLSFDLFEA